MVYGIFVLDKISSNLFLNLCVAASISSCLLLSSEVAKRPEFKGKTVVALLPDSGDRYYYTDLFKD